MGKNKLAKFAELETFNHVFQVPSSELLNGNGFELKGKWNEIFFKNSNPIALELGCGKGEYTIELAQQFPEKNYIGVDIKGARIWTGAKQALSKEMKNVAFIRTNIEMIEHFFGQNEVDEIWLTFPDPQMKKVTKRLTSTNFLQLYLKFISSNSIIHLKTDSMFMYSYTQEMIKSNHFPIVKNIEDIYSVKNIDKILNIKTYYEQQWLDRGLKIKYLAFQPQQRENYIEPSVEIDFDDYRSFKRYRRKQ
ncbi:MAG: tRNA (guanosine(46)-N7)-methyltransferase TrmB [Paludibacteraceae bacterium]